MKKIKNALIFLMIACLTAMSLASCSSTGETPTAEKIAAEEKVQAEFNDAQMRAIFGIVDEDVDVASYRIRGEARDGASFDWIEVTEPRVVIAGVRRGEWTIYAQALNEDGEVIVSGRLDTFLSSDAPTDNLVFIEKDGLGSVETTLGWNAAQVQKPEIEVYVKEDGGEFMARDASEISYGEEEGVAYWKVPQLDAGSYIARFVFKDNGTVIGGTAAALRVISGHTSIGSVNMTVADLNTPYSITLDNLPSKVTNGSLTNENGTITFSSENDTDDLTYEWYVNGEYIANETDETLNLNDLELERGLYRIDMIAQSGIYGSINSFSTVVQLESENVFSTVTAEPVSITPEVLSAPADATPAVIA